MIVSVVSGLQVTFYLLDKLLVVSSAARATCVDGVAYCDRGVRVF